MTSYIDYTSPSVRFTHDLSTSNFLKKDEQNYINVLGIKQLNTLDNTSLLDIFLSTGNVVEPHVHQNAAELVYCISGAATFILPTTVSISSILGVLIGGVIIEFYKYMKIPKLFFIQ